ncbi:MAG TPA: DUF362 domain-containing protein [Bacteroidales bacterium]|nr:DUF362 domain-containing protein [Bacteroidales bacterium]
MSDIKKVRGKIVFFILGISSTLWFLVRVIPKPSRAAYPCMRTAAPFISGFIVYLLSVWGTVMIARKTRFKKLNVRHMSTFFLVFGVIAAMAVTPVENSMTEDEVIFKTGTEDGPNQPFGQGVGINPGRVVWVWDTEATNENAINAFYLHTPGNTNQPIVSRMVADGIIQLTGKKNLKKSWDLLFRDFNIRRERGDRGYTQGDKIFIKINQGTANGKLRSDDIKNGFYIPERFTDGERAKQGYEGTCETYPNVVLELLRELVNEAGVSQKNIAIGDPISHIFGHNYDIWHAEFPDMVYLDRMSQGFGRTLTKPAENDLIFYSDKTKSDKLYDIIENADYMINVANLKPHGRAGISLTAKNHFGSHGRQSAFHLHYSLISPVSLGKPTNNGYRKYRVFVDIMGSKYLGQNTMLFVVDGLYGGGSNETRVPVKYFMPPFRNDWSNSIFISQDQVALESVCFDFLRTEWNGTYAHSPANNAYESIPNVYGVDDYLHQAADPSRWPEGISYDPDNSGRPLGSLGVHEHWNNPVRKQYSGNLGVAKGIELVSVPDTLVRSINR